MDARMIGFDTTALLRDDLVCSPTLFYLFYRTRKLIDGRPIVLAVDEFWRTDRVPAFRDENNDHLETIRKNEGVVLLATQSARATRWTAQIPRGKSSSPPTTIIICRASPCRCPTSAWKKPRRRPRRSAGWCCRRGSPPPTRARTGTITPPGSGKTGVALARPGRVASPMGSNCRRRHGPRRCTGPPRHRPP